ncbi:LysR family transcriptional regulator [Rhizobium bangladeshense]|uniref:LysR family transcriptional regulator n=1 Tax=Rhizobium bangladeshense TaxID=1138189 RepID=A0ABS7LMH0_9HYPH|nr:LysR family transcriptional regulator [Rhizobium bangladeshense]MBX4869506.1 LysR family transcriptional regulator [Rhizobium bangladeshense]MBX4874902.1 LysR family transcriptional regulator [Rhizobium bangladeshense]MBX4885057.1 LysR family transcriptional regulator [Rhizobium bangladeshense]MBX4891870.1 LysR family transcriptional regulator [Rhizobium bangladeshense]MBX4919513.1 LysR family transcriptional regulator [Rhizobium bangladeshense]
MMNDATLRKIDLNLLLTFSVLMQERNVSRAAERLLLGQPGLSAALRRLREALDDELFVRVGRGLQPTPRALSIAPAIEDALSCIERAIRPQAEFDPASWQGEFRIGMCDNLESAFFGPLAARLLELSPGARLIGIASDKRDAARRLDEGVFDFSVSVHDEPASWHIRAPLFNQTSICIYDQAQLRLKAPLRIEDFANAAHVTVSFEGNASTTIDIALGRTGHSRRVVATVPRFSALPTALRAMPAIAVVPESIGRCMAQLHGLTICEPPLSLPTDPVTMLYRRVDQADGRALWFRRLFLDVAAEALQASGCRVSVSRAAA